MPDTKMSKLRTNLDEMGYTEPMTVESMKLVEHLLRDLVSTRDTLQNYTLQSSALTIEHIQLGKENDKVNAEMACTISKLEHENKDLRLLNSHYMHKIQTLEKNSRLKSKKLDEKQPGGGEALEKISSILDRVESERDDLLLEFKRDCQHIRSMRESAESARKSEHVSQGSCSYASSTAADLSKVTSEKAELEQKIMKSESLIISLEDELHNVRNSSSYIEEELKTKESELVRVRLLLAQADSSQADLKRRMQENLTEMEGKLVQQEQSMYKLNSSFATMQRERDALRRNIDEKNKAIVNFEIDLKNKLASGADAEIKPAADSEQIRDLNGKIVLKQNEITRLTKNVCSLEIEVDCLMNSNDDLTQKNTQLHRDVALLRKRLSRQNDKTGSLFKKRVEDYVLQISNLHDLLLEKENEKEKWLNEYVNCHTSPPLVVFDHDKSMQMADSSVELDTDELVAELSDLPVTSCDRSDGELDMEQNDVANSYKKVVSSYIVSKY